MRKMDNRTATIMMAQCTAPRKMLVGGVDVELVGNPKRKV